MNENDVRGLRNLAVNLFTALDEQATRSLVLTDTLRKMFPEFGPTFDSTYQEYKNRQYAKTSPSESEAIQLLDVLLADLKRRP